MDLSVRRFFDGPRCLRIDLNLCGPLHLRILNYRLISKDVAAGESIKLHSQSQCHLDTEIHVSYLAGVDSDGKRVSRIAVHSAEPLPSPVATAALTVCFRLNLWGFTCLAVHCSGTLRSSPGTSSLVLLFGERRRRRRPTTPIDILAAETSVGPRSSNP